MKSTCTLCGCVFSGLSGFDKHLSWWTPTPHKTGPDDDYRYCKDPATLGMVLKGDRWVSDKPFLRERLAKTDT
jgi:hypothetical protein